jgi:hypothetical protein
MGCGASKHPIFAHPDKKTSSFFDHGQSGSARGPRMNRPFCLSFMNTSSSPSHAYVFAKILPDVEKCVETFIDAHTPVNMTLRACSISSISVSLEGKTCSVIGPFTARNFGNEVIVIVRSLNSTSSLASDNPFLLSSEHFEVAVHGLVKGSRLSVSSRDNPTRFECRRDGCALEEEEEEDGDDVKDEGNS